MTVVNGEISGMRDVTCGVPQGLILGPVLFICYINDLEKHLVYSRPSLFADDTALMVKGKSSAYISYRLNVDLDIAARYFASNKLQLNIKKTKCMLFNLLQRYRHDDNLLIFHENTTVEQVDSFKYLGVFLDPQLNSRRTHTIFRKNGSNVPECYGE